MIVRESKRVPENTMKKMKDEELEKSHLLSDLGEKNIQIST